MALYQWECLLLDLKQRFHHFKARLRNFNLRSVMMTLLLGSVLVGAIFSFSHNDTPLQMVSVNDHLEPENCVHALQPDSQIILPTRQPREPLLTLFTTFKRRHDRWRIHWNVLRNWSLFQPKVRMVLFDDLTDRSLIYFAKQHNWTILPVPKKSVYGTPKLKDMYYRCQKDFPSSTYFGYANGDVLFDEGLIETLEVVTSYLDQLNRSLIIGMRTNFKVNGRRIMTLEEVRQLARMEGNLFKTNAIDYFLLAHNAFPWDHVPDVVIGRPAYDNFMVATARKYDVSVIDATQTLVALHQTGKDGNHAGHRNLDAHYNSRLIGAFDESQGMTSSAQYMTRYDRWGRVELWRKPEFGGQVLLLTPALTYTMPANHSTANVSNTVTMATWSYNGHVSDNSPNASKNPMKLLKKQPQRSNEYSVKPKSPTEPNGHESQRFPGFSTHATRAKQKEGNHTNLNGTAIPEIKRNLLTLFTVFNSKSKALKMLHMNVLKNWAQYQPFIRTVLFLDSKDTEIGLMAQKLNWTIIPAITQRGTVPPIKKMFLKVQENFPESIFCGYIKGDLLFSHDLIRTLTAVSASLQEPWNALIVGKKYKIIVKKDRRELYNSKEIQSVIDSEETMLRSEYDENFLLAHQTFPWQHIPELVIGRSVYNNYVVAQALRHEFPVVDATKTLRCLEQITDDPSLMPNELDDFDPNLLGTLDYSKGFAINAQYETIYGNKTDDIKVIQRQKKSKT